MPRDTENGPFLKFEKISRIQITSTFVLPAIFRLLRVNVFRAYVHPAAVAQLVLAEVPTVRIHLPGGEASLNLGP